MIMNSLQITLNGTTLNVVTVYNFTPNKTEVNIIIHNKITLNIITIRKFWRPDVCVCVCF